MALGPCAQASAASLTSEHMRLSRRICVLILPLEGGVPGCGGLRGKPDEAQLVATQLEVTA